MQTHCQTCGEEMQLVPAGVSKKTGKPYRSFMSCPQRCKNSFNNTRPQTADPIKLLSEMMIAIQDTMLTKEHFEARMKGLSTYLKTHLGEDKRFTDLNDLPEKDDIDVSNIPFG